MLESAATIEYTTQVTSTTLKINGSQFNWLICICRTHYHIQGRIVALEEKERLQAKSERISKEGIV